MRVLSIGAVVLAACGPPKVACLGSDAEPTTPTCGGQDGCCAITWSTCEDGVTYAIECDSRDLPTTCTCFEDGVPVVTFEADGYQCPPNFEVPRVETILPFANDGCGWALR